MNVNILDVRHVPSLDPAKIGQTETLVLYTVDKGPAKYCRVASADPTDAAVKEAIQKAEGMRARFAGKMYQL